MNLTVNDTTDYLISSAVSWNLDAGYILEVDPETPIVLQRGDYWNIKIITPTWVTIPLNVVYHGSVWIDP